MPSFLEGPNRAASFTTIGTAAGIDKGTMETLAKVYGVAADLLGKYVKIGGALVGGAGVAVAAVAELVKAFGLVPQGKSDFDILYDKIRADLKKIEAAIATASHHEDAKDLATISSRLGVIRAMTVRYLAWIEKPTGSVNPEQTAFDDAATDSESLVALFQEDAFWQRLPMDSLVVKVAGQPDDQFAPPREASNAGLVWDYRATLPVFLKAIDTRLLYLVARNPNFQQANALELAQMADQLTRVHNRIQSGIRLIPSPGAQLGQLQPLLYSTALTPQWFPPFWAKRGRPYGAVDTYGGTGAIDVFPADQPEWHFSWTDEKQFLLSGSIQARNGVSYTHAGFVAQQAEAKALHDKDLAYLLKFNLLFLAQSLRGRAELEARIGLPAIRDTISKLRALGGWQHATEPPPRGRGASLRDILNPSPDVIAQLTGRQQPGLGPSSDMPTGYPLHWTFGSTAALTAKFTASLGGFGFLRPQSVRALVMGE